jgi:light-harvesting complex I chlorophyll a/b binding protein 1
MKLAITAALIGTAAAFQPATTFKSTTSLNAEYNRPSEALPFAKNGAPSTLDGTLPGDVGFDPVGFSTGDIASLFDRKNNGDTMSDVYWLREAELTHGRIAQLAVVGFIWPALYGTFPGNEWTGADAYNFPNPVEALEGAPGLALAQIVGAASWIELRRVSMIKEQGASRVPGDLGIGQYGSWNPLELNFDEEKYAEIELQEIKHCRLGMLGAAGLWLQACNSGTDVVSQLGRALTVPEYVGKAGYFLPEGI